MNDLPKIGTVWRNRYLREDGPSTAPQAPNQFTIVGHVINSHPDHNLVSVSQSGVQTIATNWPVSQFLNEFEPLPD